MRIVIIGAVAAGTSAAAKARRNSEKAEIIIYEKDSYISYSGCGIPYYIGGEVERADELTPRNEAFFKSKYNVDVMTQHEVLAVNPDEKAIKVKSLKDGTAFTDNYDKLIIASGASPVIPKIDGVGGKNVFVLRNIGDMNKISEFIVNEKPKTAAIIGSGFIGLEMCESLVGLGIKVSVIEKLAQLTPVLDRDMAIYVEQHVKEKGVSVFTNADVLKITDNYVVLADGIQIPADFVLLSTGVRPNISLAKSCGVEIGITGAIKVDEKMRTNLPDIYACGDCTEQLSRITEQPIYRPLGSTANKTGRVAGDSATDGSLLFKGVLGTGIFKVFDLTAAQTGLSQREAEKCGYEAVVCHNIKPNKPEYMGGREMIIKAVADRVSGRLLGAQIVGFEGVDKRIDVFATAITFNAMAEDLFQLDLAYAPPFSTTKDPVIYTGMILDNAINRGRPLITADELRELMKSEKEYNLIDARAEKQYESSHIDSAKSIPHSKIRDISEGLDKRTVAVTYCNKGVTGNAAQNILINKGFEKVYNLSGGFKQFEKTERERGGAYER